MTGWCRAAPDQLGHDVRVAPQADDAGLTEARGKWVLPVGDGKITQLRVDYALTLVLDSWIEMRIEAAAPPQHWASDAELVFSQRPSRFFAVFQSLAIARCARASLTVPSHTASLRAFSTSSLGLGR
jgi:hypothetical protein